MDNQKMAQFIAAMRKENNLTQKELAEQLNVTDKAVSKWERGLSCPEISSLSKLSQLLGVTTSELLHGEKAEAPVPGVEAVVEATLQYADTATKSIIAKSTRWKNVVIVSATLLLSVLALLVGSGAIDSSMGWFILPLKLTAFVWLLIMLGVFVVGKNRIASLLLCGFIIYLTTYLYSFLNQATTRDIHAYGEFTGFTSEYIPHYTIIIAMFILSIAVTVTSFLIQNKKISTDMIFLLFSISLTMIILSVLTSKSIMNYVDIQGLGVNPNFTILSLLTFLMNCFSLALLARRYRKKITQ